MRFYKVLSATPQQVELQRIKSEDRVTPDGKTFRVPIDIPDGPTFRKKVFFTSPYEPGVYVGYGKTTIFTPDEGCEGKYLYSY